MIKKFSILFLMVMATAIHAQEFDLQGHRGARGVLPENTIAAFIYALQVGVTTLEMDVVISADRKVVVSHEPYMSSSICRNTTGSPISSSQQKQYNMYRMSYDSIATFDCGTMAQGRFPGQKLQSSRKPLLSQVIIEAEDYVKNHQRSSVVYNIEIKSRPSWDGIYHPPVPAYVNLVMEVIDDYLPHDRVVIQSFDPRVLNYMHQHYPDVMLAFLTEKKGNPLRQLARLGFTPEIYSPYFRFLKKKHLRELQTRKVLVIPWTVNQERQMEKLIKWGVDGLITDYPERALPFLSL